MKILESMKCIFDKIKCLVFRITGGNMVSKEENIYRQIYNHYYENENYMNNELLAMTEEQFKKYLPGKDFDEDKILLHSKKVKMMKLVYLIDIAYHYITGEHFVSNYYAYREGPVSNQFNGFLNSATKEDKSEFVEEPVINDIMEQVDQYFAKLTTITLIEFSHQFEYWIKNAPSENYMNEEEKNKSIEISDMDQEMKYMNQETFKNLCNGFKDDICIPILGTSILVPKNEYDEVVNYINNNRDAINEIVKSNQNNHEYILLMKMFGNECDFYG